MPDHQPIRQSQQQFHQQVGREEKRRLAAEKKKEHSVWFGLGAFGVIGWSVVTPTLVGVALGCWIDHVYPSRYSWALMLMFFGLIVGCVTAWQWIASESQHEDPKSRR